MAHAVESTSDRVILPSSQLELANKVHRIAAGASFRIELEELGIRFLRLNVVDQHTAKTASLLPKHAQVEVFFE